MDLMIGYVAALEQVHPTEAVDLAAHAEAQGFSGVMAADHFQPWSITLLPHGHECGNAS